MTWVRNGDWTPQEVNFLDGRDDLRRAQALTDRGALWGPTAGEVVAILGDQGSGRPPVSPDIDRDGKNGQAVAFSQHQTKWVLSPNDSLVGIWGLNATRADDVRATEQAGLRDPDGWYYRLYEVIPDAATLKRFKGQFQQGFSEAYYSAYPGQRPVPKTPAGGGGSPGSPPAPGGFKTFELYGKLNGQLVPLTRVVVQGNGGTWTLVPGGKAYVSDTATDGFRLGGTPGAWSTYYAGRSPSEFGLDPDKGVLAQTDQGRPYAVPANVLSNIFGPGWRQAIYG